MDHFFVRTRRGLLAMIMIVALQSAMIITVWWQVPRVVVVLIWVCVGTVALLGLINYLREADKNRWRTRSKSEMQHEAQLLELIRDRVLISLERGEGDDR